MSCVTGVYNLRDITYMIFVILHFNVSHLNVRFSHFHLGLLDKCRFQICKLLSMPLDLRRQSKRTLSLVSLVPVRVEICKCVWCQSTTLSSVCFMSDEEYNWHHSKSALVSEYRWQCVSHQSKSTLVCVWSASHQIFHFQLGPKKTVSLSMIEEKWLDLALPKEQFDDLVRVGSFSGQVEWNRFFALAASALGDVSMLTLHSHVLCVPSEWSVCIIPKLVPTLVVLSNCILNKIRSECFLLHLELIVWHLYSGKRSGIVKTESCGTDRGLCAIVP